MLSVQIFTFNAFEENTYIVYNDDGDAIVIDPGCYSAAEKSTLLNFVHSHKLKVVQLINTHCHLDHIFGNTLIASTFGLELYIHPNEEQILQLSPQAGKMYGVPFDNYTGPLHFLNQGNVVKLGKDDLTVLVTPGHSPGSIRPRAGVTLHCGSDARKEYRRPTSRLGLRPHVYYHQHAEN